MPKLQLITTCMGRLQHLQQTLPTWLAQPDLDVIVVDYSCPQHSGDWAATQGPRVTVVRVPGESHFNVSKARNAGFAQSDAEWIGFIDADILLRPGFMAGMTPLLSPRHYLMADVHRGDLMGTCFLAREVVKEVGGYDEAFQGWGTEDRDFWERLDRRGLSRVSFPESLLGFIPHGNELRIQNHINKNMMGGWGVNRLYLEAKTGLTALNRRELTLAEREALYSEIRRTVEETTRTGPLHALSVSTGWRDWIGGMELNCTLTMNLRQPDQTSQASG